MNEFIVEDDDYWFEEFAENVDGDSLNCGGGGGGGGGIVKTQGDGISRQKNRGDGTERKEKNNGNGRNRHQYNNALSGVSGISYKKGSSDTSGSSDTGIVIVSGNSVNNNVAAPVLAPTPDYSAVAGLSEDKSSMRGSTLLKNGRSRKLYWENSMYSNDNGTNGSSSESSTKTHNGGGNRGFNTRNNAGSRSFGIMNSGGSDIDAFTLYGDDDNSWCSGSRLGSNWHISDTNGYMLYKSGTLSWSTEGAGSCDLKDLTVGKTYSWRVTGAINPNAKDVSYEFCGVRGGASSEVVFQINCDGECVPLSYNIPCGDDYEYGYVQESTVTLQGSIEFEGVVTAELTAKDLGVIRASLAHEFNEITDHEASMEEIVQIQAHKVVLPSIDADGSTRRLGGEHVHQVDFTVKVAADHYYVDGKDEVAVSKLAIRLSSFLDHSMHVGLFKSKILSHAKTDGSAALQSVKDTRLTHAMTVVVHKSHVDTAVSVFADVIVVVGGVVGILAGILLAMSFMRSDASSKEPQRQIPSASEDSAHMKPKTLQYSRKTLHRPAIHESLVTAFENNPVDQEISACVI